MNLPLISNLNISAHLNREEIVRETAAQIMKDFGMFGVEITFTGNIETAYQELHNQLIEQISRLVSVNYDLFLSVMYQIDISDREIVKAQQDLPHYSHTEIVAHQIIARELKKVLLRRYFREQSQKK
jgi:hypothetical protein